MTEDRSGCTPLGFYIPGLYDVVLCMRLEK